MTPIPHIPAPGQESVWAYPRPAIAEPCVRHIRIVHRGMALAESRACIRTLETSHPPSYYIPPADVALALLRPSGRHSFCEWKGHASYFDVVIGGEILRGCRVDLSRTHSSLRESTRSYRLLRSAVRCLPAR